jgi:hypothetical protein
MLTDQTLVLVDYMRGEIMGAEDPTDRREGGCGWGHLRGIHSTAEFLSP